MIMKSGWEINVEVSQAKKENRIFKNLERVTEYLLKAKGINTENKKEEFLYPDYVKNLYSPFLLSDIDILIKRIKKARKNEELICIYGDYDVDGITSATIMFDFLKQVGIKAFVYLPDRNKEGYGLNNQAIDYIDDKKADLIITVDCGITSIDEVKYAKKKNIDVIITDHHIPLETLPDALAVINPKKIDDEYPEKMLSGVGVTFKILQALAENIKEYKSEQLKWFLDLVAIGNVADCVPLLGENRTLTKFGLIVLAKTKRVGLKQLLEVGRINITSSQLPTGQQIGYQIAPRINAAGRMDHASIAYELLIKTETQIPEARLLALDIENQNKHRQKVTLEIVKEVENKLSKEEEKKIIIDSSKHWSLGLIGLVAGRLVDKYNRPVIIFQEQEKFFKGSCRSVPGFNLVENLKKVSYLLEKFGGHSQAAGLTVKKENFNKFKKEFLRLADKADLGVLKKQIIIDQEIELKDINLKLLKELLLLEPFGQGNEKPKFLSRNVKLVKLNYLGKEQQHLKIWVSDERILKPFELIMFNYKNNLKDVMKKNKSFLKVEQKLNIVYYIEENSWNGHRNIQGHLIDLEVID